MPNDGLIHNNNNYKALNCKTVQGLIIILYKKQNDLGVNFLCLMSCNYIAHLCQLELLTNGNSVFRLAWTL